MSNYDKLDPAREIVAKIVCLDLGIVPLDQDVKETFSEMLPESVRHAKRKYRKLKKKILKKIKHSVGSPVEYKKFNSRSLNSLIKAHVLEEANKRLVP